MEPLIAQLEKETGVTVDKFEVWHNEENAKKLEGLDKDGACGGVPFFINTVTGKTICGEATVAELKEWAGK
jgi:hypothetical protein